MPTPCALSLKVRLSHVFATLLFLSMGLSGVVHSGNHPQQWVPPKVAVGGIVGCERACCCSADRVDRLGFVCSALGGRPQVSASRCCRAFVFAWFLRFIGYELVSEWGRFLCERSAQSRGLPPENVPNAVFQGE